MKSLHKNIGQRIALLRQENHITQAQLAELLDISIKHCSEVERGLACLSLEKLVALCSILSTDLDYLVRGIDRRPSEETNIPSYITKIFDTEDYNQKELLQEYLLLFKKISEQNHQPQQRRYG